MPLWRCPVCRRKFANRNQSHACGRYSLGSHFNGKSPIVRKLFNLFVAKVRSCGRVTILPEKTRIAFQVRMSFASLHVQKSRLTGHLVLAERYESPCFVKVESFSRQNHVHQFRIETAQDLSKDLCEFIKKAYAVGEQKHLL